MPFDVVTYAAAKNAAAKNTEKQIQSAVSLTDKDDNSTLYAMAWSVEDGHPVLTLTERT